MKPRGYICYHVRDGDHNNNDYVLIICNQFNYFIANLPKIGDQTLIYMTEN